MNSNRLKRKASVLEYSVLEARTLKEIISDVNTQIQEGWQPIGGIAMRQSLWEGNVYVQSMQLVEDDADDEDEDEDEDDAEDEEDEEEDSAERETEEDSTDRETEEDSAERETEEEHDSNRSAHSAHSASSAGSKSAMANFLDDIFLDDIGSGCPDDSAECETKEADDLPVPAVAVSHTQFCVKYKYVDCNCGPAVNGCKGVRNVELTESDDERVSEGIDIQARTFSYPYIV